MRFSVTNYAVSLMFHWPARCTDRWPLVSASIYIQFNLCIIQFRYSYSHNIDDAIRVIEWINEQVFAIVSIILCLWQVFKRSRFSNSGGRQENLVNMPIYCFKLVGCDETWHWNIQYDLCQSGDDIVRNSLKDSIIYSIYAFLVHETVDQH